MNIKLKDVVANKDTLINCKTKEQFNLIVKIAEEQFKYFQFQKHSTWDSYKSKTMISIPNNTFGPLDAYIENIYSPTKIPNIVQAKDIIVTKDENPEYFL